MGFRERAGRAATRWRWAAAEVALVFVGVLLALWVENWSQERHEVDLRDAYLAGLIRDVEADIRWVDGAIGSTRNRISAPLERAVDVFVAQQLPDADTLGFIRDMQMASYITLPSSSDGTFQDMVGSGNLRLLDDMELRARLFGYYSYVDWLDRYHDAFLATKAQQISQRVAGSVPPRLFTYAYDLTDRLSPERRSVDLAGILADEQLEASILGAWTIALWQENYLGQLRSRAVRLRDALQEAAGRTVAPPQGEDPER